MAATDERWPQPPRPGDVWSDAFGWMPGTGTYTGFAERWFGGEYPAGRGQLAANPGWTCPGCSRGYAPSVLVCQHCGPGPEQRMSGVTVSAPVMGDWGQGDEQ